jgi:hypothetical protein
MDEEVDWSGLAFDVELQIVQTEIGSAVSHMLEVYHHTVVAQALDEITQASNRTIKERYGFDPDPDPDTFNGSMDDGLNE